jgi:hypothetical protein
MKFIWIILCLLAPLSLCAGDLDTIGVTLLRQFDPALQGAGVKVAQVEAPADQSSPPIFEVVPDSVGQPVGLFTFLSGLGSASTYTNTVGIGSGHAINVGNNFYGLTNGAAPQVSHVDNYEVEFFFTNIIGAASPPTIQARVINQSFLFDQSAETNGIDQAYDDYAFNKNKIFVNGVGNSGQVGPPGTCYNDIGVGIYTSPSAVGPSTDGRCKPDITAPDLANAPSGANSFSTPYVAGSAAILVQAAGRGDGGANTNAAADLTTIKALLLNGAIKLPDWTNSLTSPLDLRYGAGVVNVFNSWKQLRGGKQPFIESTIVSTGNPHPPGASSANEPVLVGWDFNAITNTASQDKISHYYFNLPGTNSYTLTATLVWNRKAGNSTINDLNLFLYDLSNTNLTSSSVSTVDNVEHLFLPQLAPGRYDLQVLKKGSGQVSMNQSYALAFEFFNLALQIAPTNDSVAISWPAAPTGFTLQSTTSLTPPIAWTPVGAPVAVDTNASQNIVSVPADNPAEFFRLQRP